MYTFVYRGTVIYNLYTVMSRCVLGICGQYTGVNRLLGTISQGGISSFLPESESMAKPHCLLCGIAIMGCIGVLSGCSAESWARFRAAQAYGASTMDESFARAWRNSFGAPTTSCTTRCHGGECRSTCIGP